MCAGWWPRRSLLHLCRKYLESLSLSLFLMGKLCFIFDIKLLFKPLPLSFLQGNSKTWFQNIYFVMQICDHWVVALQMNIKLIQQSIFVCHIGSHRCDYPPIIIPLNTELNPICHLLALLEAHHILHVSRIRVKCFDDYNILTCISAL
jgi:hypothetical protein